MGNFAFIDNQNLYMATTKNASEPWKLDMQRLHEYLKKKYKCDVIYLFMGAYKQDQTWRYTEYQKIGYVLIHREHGETLKGKKKGNVDTDIVFQVMHDLVEERNLDKVVLVSGDGDYKRMVDYPIKKDRFEMILLLCKERASSLYKAISNKHYAYLDTKDMRTKLGKVKGGELR